MARFALECVREAAATRIDDSDPAAGTVKIRAGFHSGPVVGQVREKESSKVSISKLKEQKDIVAVWKGEIGGVYRAEEELNLALWIYIYIYIYTSSSEFV